MQPEKSRVTEGNRKMKSTFLQYHTDHTQEFLKRQKREQKSYNEMLQMRLKKKKNEYVRCFPTHTNHKKKKNTHTKVSKLSMNMAQTNV